MKNYRFLGFIIVVLVLGLIFSPIRPIKNTLYFVFSPITGLFSRVSGSVSGFFADIGSISELSESNKRLTNEKNLLEAQVVELQEYKYENEILKQELQILDTNTQDELVASKIISKEISPFLQNVILDKGEKDGIREGQAILSQGYLVGIIAQVYDDYSQAEMINGSKTMIPVLLQDSRATGILTSHLDGLFIENIPIDNELRHGEVVLTSNLSQNIPENVLVGKVDKIVKYDSQIFQTIKVITPIDFSKLEFVFIVKR